MAKNPILRFFDFLAKMGLMVRDDPPRVIDVAARSWGEPVDGFVLSIEQIPSSLSVVLRNVGATAQTLTIPDWLHFYRLEIEASVSPFGREIFKPERQSGPRNLTFQSGEPVETQIPIGSLFTLRQEAEYRTRVSCMLPSGGTLRSNTVTISA